MSLNKVDYVDYVTVISANNLNAIQDEIINNAESIITNTENIETNTTNISNLQTAVSSKQATITGGASTITSDDLLTNRVVISNSNGKVDVSDITATELSYLDDTTSNIQTQLNNKQATITGAVSTITSDNLTVSRALISNNAGKVDVSDITATELNCLDNVTTNIQAQLNSKQSILTFDDEPTENSNNPVKSGGVYNAIENIVEELDDNLATKTDLNALADLTVIKRETSGAIVSLTDISETDVDELIVSIEAVQEGSGNPAPDNVRPIVGWDEVDITINRKNLYNKNDATSFIDRAYINTGQSTIGTESAGRGLVYIPCKPNTTYTVSRERVLANDRFTVGYTRKIPESNLAVYNISSAPNSGTVGETLSLTITTGADARYLVVWVFWSDASEALDTLQIEFGSTATAYEQYRGNTYDINLGQTVYGGTLNVTTGELIINNVIEDLGDLTWIAHATINDIFYTVLSDAKPVTVASDRNKGCMTTIYPGSSSISIGSSMDDKSWLINSRNFYVRDSAYTDVNVFKQAMNGVKLVYEIETPQTVQLTPTQIATLVGDTNIWANTGDIVNLKYTANASLLINQIIQAIIANGGNV